MHYIKVVLELYSSSTCALGSQGKGFEFIFI